MHEAAAALLEALTLHPTLRSFWLSCTAGEHRRAAAGAAIAALVAADSPALTTLNMFNCGLGDAGLAPIFEALPRNTHLLELSLRMNDMTAEFVQQRMIPAVTANTSLRVLGVFEIGEDADFVSPLLRQAVQIVKARRGVLGTGAAAGSP